VAETARWYDAVTETRVVALQGNAEALIDVFEDNFDMAMDYLAVMSRAQIRLLDMKVMESGRAIERFYGSSESEEESEETTTT
jgi:hypothetical protein